MGRAILGLALLASLPLIYADYTEFFFTANGTCPDLAWSCTPGSVLAACAYDSIVGKYYCCGAADQATCRINSPTCLGADGGPSSVQQSCTVGSSTWCCLNSEECTPKEGQINVCIAKAEDTIGNVSQELLNETFSSLSAKDPTATTFLFDATSLSAAAAALATSSSATTSGSSAVTSSSSTSTPSSSPTSTPSTSSSGTLSGGSIAGIVVGCLAGIAALITAAYFVFRRRRTHTKVPTKEPFDHSYGARENTYTDEKPMYPAEVAGSAMPTEMGSAREAQELAAENKRLFANELPG